MKTWSSRILLALAFSAASSLAFAAEEQAPGSGQPAGQELPSFEQIDADSNGYLEQNELQDLAGIDWKEADGDNDGRVNVQEFEYAKRNLMPTKGEMNLPSTGDPNVPADVEVNKK